MGGRVITDSHGQKYQLGDCIGKGAFGAVYKCLNLQRGDLIAVKIVKLENFPKSKSKDLTIEIELLKNLKHPKIVKYIGVVKTKDELHILMEYCESGSLAQIIKKFGKFPETLVAIYVRQVLEGLKFLHEEGVIHRDIKAANIVTTKDGSVKLADFGVATRQADLTSHSFEGSPYWMAPEVIELSGPAPASDIWSVGCTIIELTTGHPPYFPKDALHAMYRMVHDDHPPLPDGISIALRDFLLQCFHKDVNLRSSAKKLIKHAWIQSVRHESNQITDDQIALRAKSKLSHYSTSDRPRRHQGERQESQDDKNYIVNLPPPETEEDDDWEKDFADLDNGDDRVSLSTVRRHSGGADTLASAAATARLSVADTIESSPPLPHRPGLDEKVRLANGHNDSSYLSYFGTGRDLSISELRTKSRRLSHDYSSAEESSEEAGTEDDPFALIDDDEFPEERAWRDQLSAEIHKLIKELTPNQKVEVVLRSLSQLRSIFKDAPDMKGKVITYHGMINLIEILEAEPSDEVVAKVLAFLNQIFANNREIQENLCLVGGIPTIMTYGRKSRDKKVRLEVAVFIQLMCEASVMTLQTFISCQGLPILVGFLDEDYQDHKALIWMAINGINTVFKLQSPTPKNDFCRLFARSGLLFKLAEAFRYVNSDPDPQAMVHTQKILNVFLIFSQADSVVKELMANKAVLRCLMREMDHLPPDLLVIWLRCLKNLSMSMATLPVLQSAGVIQKLVPLLDRRNGPYIIEIYNQVLNTMYNLCRMAPSRQQIACNVGIVPHLQDIVIQNSALKQFAIPILCDLPQAGESCRQTLYEHDGVRFYVYVLKDPYWQVNALEAIAIWLEEDMDHVEGMLLDHFDRLLETLLAANANSFGNLLGPLHRISLLSPEVAQALLTSDSFYDVLSNKLCGPNSVVRRDALKILSNLLQEYSISNASIPRSFVEQIEVLERKDPSLLVRQSAGGVLKALRMRNPR